MQDITIIFLEYIYISGISSQILLCLTSKRCQRCPIRLGFHRTQVIGSCKCFHFTKIVLWRVFLVVELKIDSGFSASCKHCHPLPPAAAGPLWQFRLLCESSGNPSPMSNLNSPGILCTSALPSPALTSSRGRGLPLAVLIQKGVRVSHRLGKDAKISSLFLLCSSDYKVKMYSLWKI